LHAATALAALPDKDRHRLYDLTEVQARDLFYDWQFWARREQLPPVTNPHDPSGTWRIWFYCGGRGSGKSRAHAEWVRAEVESGRRGHLALVGRTPADVRDVMIEGEAGLLAISRPDFRPVYEPTKRKLTWPNGAVALTYSGAAPDQLRGPSFDGGWVDELAAFKYPDDTWNNLLFGMRLGSNPQVVVSTTPRPIPIIKGLLKDPTCVVTRGSSNDNIGNLPEAYIEQVIRRYEGTRLGRQEIYAEILDDTPGALWTHDLLERTRTREHPELSRIVVGVDPAVSSGEGAAETGIIVAGALPAQHGRVAECYVLDDLTLRGTPHEWASAVVTAYRRYRCDRVVAESNQGGEMVEATIHAVDPTVPVLRVHASRGKYVRAEPVAALYEHGAAHHVGLFPELEDEMVTFVPGEASPDRLDALVWAITALVGNDIPSSSSYFPDPQELTRSSPWTSAFHGLTRTTPPHLATDY